MIKLEKSTVIFENIRSFAMCMVCLCTTGTIEKTYSHGKQQSVECPTVYGFSLPIFGADGIKLFEAYGDTAEQKQEKYLVNGAKLVFFSESENTGMVSAISDFAVIDPSSHSASGESTVYITGENFRAKADSWEFFGDSKRMVAKKNVEVVITGNSRGD